MTNEEAIEEIKRWTPILLNSGQCTEKTSEAQDMAISALSENKGEWIDKGNGSYVCSNCKTEWTTSQIEKMCFCPTCGNPKVRGGKAE